MDRGMQRTTFAKGFCKWLEEQGGKRNSKNTNIGKSYRGGEVVENYDHSCFEWKMRIEIVI